MSENWWKWKEHSIHCLTAMDWLKNENAFIELFLKRNVYNIRMMERCVVIPNWIVSVKQNKKKLHLLLFTHTGWLAPKSKLYTRRCIYCDASFSGRFETGHVLCYRNTFQKYTKNLFIQKKEIPKQPIPLNFIKFKHGTHTHASHTHTHTHTPYTVIIYETIQEYMRTPNECTDTPYALDVNFLFIFFCWCRPTIIFSVCCYVYNVRENGLCYSFFLHKHTQM